jgi:hypothetical protein
MAASLIIGWMALGRAVADRQAMAAVFVGIAGFISCIAAELAVRRLRRPGRAAQFAAAIVALTVGTISGASFLLGIERAWASHPLLELPPKIVFMILTIVGAGSLYTFMSIAAWLILPLGLPIIVLTAFLLARPR